MSPAAGLPDFGMAIGIAFWEGPSFWLPGNS